MEDRIISKKDFQGLLTNLTGKYQVFAPVKKEDSLLYEQICPGTCCEDIISFTYTNTKKGIKEIYFPQRERLFAFNLLKKDEVTQPDDCESKRIVIGVRPCDARSIHLLDPVFQGDKYNDPYFTQKRDNTVIIAFGCNLPEKTCFCTTTGGNPFSTDGSDILLVDLKDFFLMQPVTKKGEDFLKQESISKKAQQEHIKLKEKIAQNAGLSIESQINTKKVKEKLDKNFDDPLWENIYKKCLGCGICTYFCPTCHCFDILDETKGQEGERLRIWDSCMFPQFTLHASGANPRPTGKERMRQRVMHKFKYFTDNFGAIACSGCGRCVKYCPVNLDIRKVLIDIQDQT